MTFLRRLSFACAAATFAAAPLAAQSAQAGASPNPVIARIWRLGMDSSHVQQLSQALFDSVGPRLTGGPGLLAASNWAIGQYKSWGIDAKRENYGTWRGWRRGTSHIDLMSPRVRSLDGTMLAWSPGTNGKPINAEVIVLPEVQRQHGVREVAAAGEGQDRDGLAGVADLPSVRRLVPLVDT